MNTARWVKMVEIVENGDFARFLLYSHKWLNAKSLSQEVVKVVKAGRARSCHFFARRCE
jgi:hypothetical protein